MKRSGTATVFQKSEKYDRNRQVLASSSDSNSFEYAFSFSSSERKPRKDPSSVDLQKIDKVKFLPKYIKAPCAMLTLQDGA